MPIYHQGRKVKEVYHQGRKVKEIWHMGRIIYSSKPVEIMPATPNYYTAMDWLRTTVQKYGLGYTTVRELPFNIDSRNATSMSYMFYGCSSLTTAPAMDTSKVTSMSLMFRDCSSLTTVPQLDTSQVTNFDGMFLGCKSLTDGNVTLTVKRKGASTTTMISGSGLTREPFLTIE
mgnify:CR=1 FL=1